MILCSKDGASFGLSLEAVPLIERPIPGTNKWDSWLNINISVRCPQGRWQVTDECLLLHEAEELAEWLEAIAHGQSTENEISFTEPSLRLLFAENTSTNLLIRVSFMSELRPTWFRGKVFELDFQVTLEDLTLQSQRLKEEVFNYTRIGC